MSAVRQIKLIAAIGLVAIALAGALGGLIALNAGGAVRLGEWRALELASGYDRAAAADLAYGGRARLAQVEARSRRATMLNPYDIGAWLRIAYVDAAAHGALTPAGVAALARSYDLVAYDTDQASWRIAFALEHWGELPPELQAEVKAETFTLGVGWRHRLRIMEVLRNVTNPAGRMTASLWASQIESVDWR